MLNYLLMFFEILLIQFAGVGVFALILRAIWNHATKDKTVKTDSSFVANEKAFS